MEELIRYCQPTGPLPDLVGSRSGNLLIIGSAGCVTDDLEAYHHLHVGERMAVNDAIPWYPGKLDYAVSLHPEFLWFWVGKRKDKPLPMSTHRIGGQPDIVWPLHADGATSGLFAVITGLLMGFDSIVLAGVPVSDEPKITGKTGYTSADTMRQEWMKFSQFFNGKVKSLSGWTKNQFGEP